MTGVRASRGAAPALPAETDLSKWMKDIPNTHYYTSLEVACAAALALIRVIWK